MSKKLIIKPSIAETAEHTAVDETLGQLKAFLELLTKHSSVLANSYRIAPRKPTLQRLILTLPAVHQEFSNQKYSNLLATIQHYASNNASEERKKFCKEFLEFLSNPNFEDLGNLQESLDKVIQAAADTAQKKQNANKPAVNKALPTSPKDEAVKTLEAKKSSKQEAPAITVSNIELPSSIYAAKDVAIGVRLPNQSSKATPLATQPVTLGEKESNKDTSELPNAITDHASNQEKEPQQEISNRLALLIALIRNEQNKLSEGAHSFFAVGKGKKSRAIENALEWAISQIGNFKDTPALCTQFLNIKLDSQQSLYEALNIHRLSPIRKNGNSLFTNSTADSLARINEFVECDANNGASGQSTRLQA